MFVNKSIDWNLITDILLGLTIAFVAIAMLTSPLWLCALLESCNFV